MAINKFTTAVQAAKAIKSMLPDSFYEDIKKYVEMNRPQFSRHSPAVFGTAFHTLPARAGY